MLYHAELLQTLWRNKAGYWWIGKGIRRCCTRLPALSRESDVSASGHSAHAGTHTPQFTYMHVYRMAQGCSHLSCTIKSYNYFPLSSVCMTDAYTE